METADRHFLMKEEGYLACRVADLRAAIDIAVADLNRSLVQAHSVASFQAVVLKVLNDLEQTCENKPPLIGPQPTGSVQSHCLHCERRTGSKSARLCRPCSAALRGAEG